MSGEPLPERLYSYPYTPIGNKNTPIGNKSTPIGNKSTFFCL